MTEFIGDIREDSVVLSVIKSLDWKGEGKLNTIFII